MRLYLSSFRLGDRTDLLVDLVRRPGGAPSVGVIANSIDEGDPVRRGAAVATEIEQLRELGLDPHEIDLRDYDPGAGTLRHDLAACAALWVRGGNAFVLRYVMAISGADGVIVDLLAHDSLVYAGYSAGPCVLAPSLRGIEGCDDIGAVRRLYDADPVWDGLSILDRPFVPHLDSPGHPETGLLREVAASYRREGTPHWALRDGQVLVVDGGLEGAVLV